MDNGVEASLGGGGVDFRDQHLFGHCLTVAGVLHVFSNASKDLYKALNGWTSLYASLKVLEPLVTHKDRLRKYVCTCVEQSPHSTKPFRVIAPRLYDKRWGEVYKFCKWLQDRLPIMRATWDAARFEVRTA